MLNRILSPGILFLAFSCFSITIAHGQQAVSASGGNASSTSGKVSYTVGQVGYKTVSGTTGTIQEGVQQPVKPTVTPANPTSLVISNYVSPNNDGDNDTWKVSSITDVANLKVVVTDQWGTVVFQKEQGYQNEWDANVPDGVYYYTFLENTKVVYQGSITILSN